MQESQPILRATISPSRTTGCSRTRCRPRIPTSGWFTSGVAKSPPSFPPLETVNVEPRSSSGLSVPALALSASRAPRPRGRPASARSALADDRDDEALLRLHGQSEVEALEEHDLLALQTGVQLRHRTEAVHRRLEKVGQVAPLASHLVQRREVAFLDDRDGGDLPVCRRQMCSDQLAHAPERLAALALAGLRLGSAARAPHVVLRDPSLRARPGDGREFDPELRGQPADERRRPDAIGRRRRRRDWGILGGGLLRRRLGPRLLVTGRCRAVRADHDENGADGHRLALLDEDLRDLPGRRGRDLDGRLVRLDLDQRLILADLVALGDEPARDLALGQAFAEVGELELVRHRLILSARSPRRSDPRVGRRDQDAETDPRAVLAAELPERDRLRVDRDVRRDGRRDVAGLEPALGIPDPDGVRVVLVLRLGDERQPEPGRERGVLQGVESVRGAGDRNDEEPLVVPPDRLPRRGVAQPVAGLPALEPETQPSAQNSRTRRAAATTRSTEGMYASSICQYG